MSRNVNVPDNAVVIVLTPKQGVALWRWLCLELNKLPLAVVDKIRNAVEGSEYDAKKKAGL